MNPEETRKVDVTDMEILAWVGPDEFNGSRGLKAAVTPVGWVPLAFKGEHLDRATNEDLKVQLQKMANQYGTQMQLVRFKFEQVVLTVDPTL